MERRWVTVKVGVQEAREYVQTVRQSIDLLRRAAPFQPSIAKAVETERLTFALADLADLLERGLDEIEPEVDEWQRPFVSVSEPLEQFTERYDRLRNATPSSDPTL